MFPSGVPAPRSALALTLSFTALAARRPMRSRPSVSRRISPSSQRSTDDDTVLRGVCRRIRSGGGAPCSHRAAWAALTAQYATVDRDESAVAVRGGAMAMIFIAPDYRAKTSWMGPAAEADVVQIISDLRRAHCVGKVFLVGGSMGGSSALTFAALHPELIAGVSSQNGTANHLEYRNFQDAIRASFGGTKAEIPEEYKKRSAEYWPERLTMPMAMTVGGKDASVPPDSVRRLAAVLQEMDRPVLLIDRPQMGHSTDYADTTAALDFVIVGLGLVTNQQPDRRQGSSSPSACDRTGRVESAWRFLPGRRLLSTKQKARPLHPALRVWDGEDVC